VAVEPPRERPQSATQAGTAWALLLSFLLGVAVLIQGKPFANIVHSALFLILLMAVAVFAVDLLAYKVHRRETTGLDFSRWTPSLARTGLKYLGLLGSLGFVAALYWLLPEYHGSFYDRYYELLRIILVPWLVLAVPYLYLVDARMNEPRDGYWQMGKLMTLRLREVDRAVVWNHLLGWIVKGYFLPLMFVYACNNLDKFTQYDFSRLTSFAYYFDFLIDFMYFADVGLAAMGYLMTLRLCDTHLRSTEPTMLGWIVTLVCYQPLWSIVGKQYLDYETGHPWGVWLWNMPLLHGVWGSVILLLVAVYLWATVIFAARFSNLTHRGIITNGPYRFTKHPAYLAKNLSYWLISVPFLVHESWGAMIRACLLLLLLNGIYYLRARTEEAHLSRDPAYVLYALWMEAHGPLSGLASLPCMGWLKYRAPSSARRLA
jgi:Isoprenylcysteine carboxyl methyltransferase (ICMT) family